MSVLRRLYNVAYGKVRSWQHSGPPDDVTLDLASVGRERPVGLRERWSPPIDDARDDAPSTDAPSTDAPSTDALSTDALSTDAVPRTRRL